MSDKWMRIVRPALPFLLFLVLAYLFDRDMLRYPLVHDEGKQREKANADVVATITLYNKIFSDFYASGGVPTLLNDFPATKFMRHVLFRDIGFIHDSGRVLVYDLAEITPVNVTFPVFNKAEAVVFEEWNYLYQRSDTRKPVAMPKGMGQGFQYRLVKVDGSWIVTGWDPVEVTEPEKKGFVF